MSERLSQIEQMLGRMERARTLALACNDIGFWDHDLVADDLWWSPQMFHVFGVTLRSLLERGSTGYERFNACLHPLWRDRVWAAYSNAMAGNGHYVYEFVAVGDDEQARRIMGRGNIEWSNGVPIRAAGICVLIASDYSVEKDGGP